jgi:hypothetical protein
MTRLLGIAACFLIAGLATAQFRQSGREEPNLGTLPAHPEAEFHFARLAYDSHGCYAGSRGYSNPCWAVDYPLAEEHFLPALERFTRIDAAGSSAHVQLGDVELFDYPWIFLQQPGQSYWTPTEFEAERLREYLLRGGFLVVDDFHGEDEWLVFEEAIRQVLPGRPIVDIPPEDTLLSIIFAVDSRTQIPGDRHLNGYGRGTPNMEGPPHWRAIYDDEGRMIVAINHNIDMGDAWEHADRPDYPVEMSGLAYRFGVNYVIYAMTH